MWLECQAQGRGSIRAGKSGKDKGPCVISPFRA